MDPEFQKLFEQGNSLYQRGDLEQAAACFRRALAIDPQSIPATYNFGIVLRDLEQWPAAAAQFRQVLARNPRGAHAHNNLGIVAERMGQHTQALEHYREAIRQRSQFPDAHFNLGMLLWRLGFFREGLAECEWRWQTDRFTPLQCPQPKWDGTQLPGTLLVHTEQGAGDAIQFIRFIPEARRRCQRLILICTQNLLDLLSCVPGIDRILTPGTVPLTDFQAYQPLLSLPFVLGTTWESIPSHVPYLSPPRRPFELPAPPTPNPRVKVGLTWAGSPTHDNDHHRSCRMEDLLPLLEVEEVAFYSLQVGPPAAELAELGPRAESVADVQQLQHDFGDAALAIEQLDLVITVDTAVLHLAGALAKPVWGLLSVRSDYRWMDGREDSPWYPTLKLFRQNHIDDWNELVLRVRAELQRLARERARKTGEY